MGWPMKLVKTPIILLSFLFLGTSLSFAEDILVADWGATLQQYKWLSRDDVTELGVKLYTGQNSLSYFNGVERVRKTLTWLRDEDNREDFLEEMLDVIKSSPRKNMEKYFENQIFQAMSFLNNQGSVDFYQLPPLFSPNNENEVSLYSLDMNPEFLTEKIGKVLPIQNINFSNRNCYRLQLAINSDDAIKGFGLGKIDESCPNVRVFQEDNYLLFYEEDSRSWLKVGVVNSELRSRIDLNIEATGQFSLVAGAKKYRFEAIFKQKRGWIYGVSYPLTFNYFWTQDRDPSFDALKTYGLLVPIGFLQVFDGLFGSLIWAFFTKDFKVNLIASTVKETLDDDENLKNLLGQYFTEDQLVTLSTQVAENCVPTIAPFLTAKKRCYREAHAVFIHEVVKSELLKFSDFVPMGDGQANAMAGRVLSDFNMCITEANDIEGIDSCRVKFEISSGARVGKELLGKILSEELGKNGLSESQIMEINYQTGHIFDECIQLHYLYKYRSHRWYRTSEFDAAKTTMACVYSGIVHGVTLSLRDVFHNLAADLYSNDTQNLEAIKNSIQNEVNSYFGEEGLFLARRYYQAFPYEYLENLETSDFREKLDAALSKITVYIGDIVARKELDSHPSLRSVTGGNSQAMNSIIQVAIEEGFNGCLEIQGENVDPTKCRGLIELVATREAVLLKVGDVLRTAVGGENNEFRDVYEQIKAVTNLCFNIELETQRDNIRNGREPQINNAGVLNCIREIISSTAFHLTKVLVQQKLVELGLGENALSNDSLYEFQLFGETCFGHELEQFNDLDTTVGGIDTVQTKCTLMIYQKVIPSVAELVLNQKLSSYIDNQDDRDQLVSDLLIYIQPKLAELRGEEGLDGLIQDLSAEATFRAMSYFINQQIDKYFTGNASISRGISESLLGTDLRDGLSSAYGSSTASAVDQYIFDFQIRAARVISREVLPLKVGNFLEDPELRARISSDIVTLIYNCFDQIPNMDPHTMEGIDNCKLLATNEATFRITENLVEQNLNSVFDFSDDPSITPADLVLVEQMKSRVRNGIINDDLRVRINEANKNDNPADLDRFKNETYKLAGPLFAQEKILFFLEKKVPFYSQKQRLLSELVEVFNGCLSEFDLNQPEGVAEHLNQCINKIVLRSMEKIVTLIFMKEAMGVFSKDDPQFYHAITHGVNLLKGCFETIDPNQESKQFSDRADSCIGSVIFSFAGNMINLAKLRYQPILKDSTLDYNFSCHRNVLNRVSTLSGVSTITNRQLPSEFSLKIKELADALYLIPNTKVVDYMQQEIGKCANEFILELLPQFIDDALSPTGVYVNSTNAQFVTDISNLLKSSRLPSLLLGGDSDTSDGTDELIQFSLLSTAPTMSLNDLEAGRLTEEQTEFANKVKGLLQEHGALFVQTIIFGQSRTVEAVREMLNEIERVFTAGTKPDLDRLLPQVFESDLGDLLIKTKVSQIIKNDSMAVVREMGLWGTFVNSVSSLEAMDRIFHREIGRTAKQSIIQDYLVPLMSGNSDSDAIPSEVMNTVVRALVRDRQVGGFVESILGEVIQIELNQAVEDNGIGTWRGKLAWIAGYRANSTENDFSWADDHRGANGLRDTPSGHKAIRYFADHMLFQILTDDDFKEGTSDYDSRKQILSGMIEAAQSENSREYSSGSLDSYLNSYVREDGNYN